MHRTSPSPDTEHSGYATAHADPVNGSHHPSNRKSDVDGEGQHKTLLQREDTLPSVRLSVYRCVIVSIHVRGCMI